MQRPRTRAERSSKDTYSYTASAKADNTSGRAGGLKTGLIWRVEYGRLRRLDGRDDDRRRRPREPLCARHGARPLRREVVLMQVAYM